LPEWFGIEEYTQQYIKDIESLPTWLALIGDQVVGFLAIHEHYPQAAEIHTIGVRPELHRQGTGRALVQAAENYLRQRGGAYLQVKTLSPSRPDERYASTRSFYAAMGFQPLEEFPELWEPGNPCLQMIKHIAPAEGS
jgi:ribosomal protein S18 acetylase RimI-like enzyme